MGNGKMVVSRHTANCQPNYVPATEHHTGCTKAQVAHREPTHAAAEFAAEGTNEHDLGRRSRVSSSLVYVLALPSFFKVRRTKFEPPKLTAKQAGKRGTNNKGQAAAASAAGQVQGAWALSAPEQTFYNAQYARGGKRGEHDFAKGGF